MELKLDETQAVVGTLSVDPTINGYTRNTLNLLRSQGITKIHNSATQQLFKCLQELVVACV